MAASPSITQFFANELRAPLVNQRWSWGSFQEATNCVFLRVWAHDLHDAPGGGRMVRLLKEDWTRSSLGYLERVRHIDRIKGGAEAFGVIATAAPGGSGPSRIQSYNSQELAELGSLLRPDWDPESLFARISRTVPVAQIGVQIRSIENEVADVAELFTRPDLQHKPTDRRVLIDARLGQGKFRRQLLAKWDDACAVTGSTVLEALRASHMKPWAGSSDEQRLDPNNGLPLVGTLDALFDRGLISFEGNGSMLISGRVSKKEIRLLGLQGRLRQALNAKQLEFLAFHRNHYFGKTQ